MLCTRKQSNLISKDFTHKNCRSLQWEKQHHSFWSQVNVIYIQLQNISAFLIRFLWWSFLQWNPSTVSVITSVCWHSYLLWSNIFGLQLMSSVLILNREIFSYRCYILELGEPATSHITGTIQGFSHCTFVGQYIKIIKNICLKLLLLQQNSWAMTLPYLKII